jgi:hypothetical protein
MFFNVVERVALWTQKFLPPYYVTSVIKIVFNLVFYVFGATAPSGPGPPHLWGF